MRKLRQHTQGLSQAHFQIITVNIINTFQTNFTCSVGNNILQFEAKTNVRQNCVISAVLFSVAIDWVMRTATEDVTRVLQWTPFYVLEDLYFADYLVLPSPPPPPPIHHLTQEKTTHLSKVGRQVGLVCESARRRKGHDP